MATHHFTLVPQPLTETILMELEDRGLVRMLRPTRALLNNPQMDRVDTIYESSREDGAHTMICVRKNQTEIRFTVHSDNEDVLFVNPGDTALKPLYIIFALYKGGELKQRAADGNLTADDFLALQVTFNNPTTCIFTIYKDTPHCEITAPGNDEAPIFYVTEPSQMKMSYIDFPNVVFSLGSKDSIEV